MHAFFLCFYFRNHVRYIQPFLSCRRQSLSRTKGRLLWKQWIFMRQIRIALDTALWIRSCVTFKRNLPKSHRKPHQPAAIRFFFGDFQDWDVVKIERKPNEPGSREMKIILTDINAKLSGLASFIFVFEKKTRFLPQQQIASLFPANIFSLLGV